MRDEQGRTALHLAVLFKGTGGTAQADNKSSEDEGSQLRSMQRYFRDGCEVVSKLQPVPLTKLIGVKEGLNCKPETRYRCAVCIDFDFCFRCILDKEIIHFKEHALSPRPA